MDLVQVEERREVGRPVSGDPDPPRAVPGVRRIGVVARTLLIVLVATLALQVTDAIMTYVLVGHGLMREANPIMRHLLGEGSFLPAKLAGALVSATGLWVVGKWFPRLALGFALLIGASYWFVVVWNAVLLAVG